MPRCSCNYVGAFYIMTKTEDLTGRRFTRLVVVNRDYSKNKRDALWLCECDCGKKTIVAHNKLRAGKTKSCGCYNKDRATKHNMWNSPEYHAWEAIIQRCRNAKNPNYNRYGGRGITVCERWLHSFENFLEDMGRRPSPKHSIDRENNDKGYYLENCRWATRTEQQRNNRNCVLILDVETGVFYTTIREASICNDIEFERLRYLLRYNRTKKFIRA
jgi:hypothetical protein